MTMFELLSEKRLEVNDRHVSQRSSACVFR